MKAWLGIVCAITGLAICLRIAGIIPPMPWAQIEYAIKAL